MALFFNKLASLVPGLHAIDVDVPLEILRKDKHKLEQKLQIRRRGMILLTMIAAGLAEITKQIQAINEVYKLHNLPEFYRDPGPHNSEKQRPKVHPLVMSQLRGGCMYGKEVVVKRATIDGNALLLIKGIDPRVMFACHRHSSAKACRAHYLPNHTHSVKYS
ncbi:unnamed protein product [Prunus armeniaca]|uniref:U6 snRNA phosphodiesterase 1 n=1 Tax=Prunus armeniaca TaxID=36596 RepID=A0A6J5X650_PRUAR|nr:unnamed protein product [Prunus armeniaca]